MNKDSSITSIPDYSMCRFANITTATLDAKLHEIKNWRKFCGKIYDRARKRGISHDQMKAELNKLFGISSSKELSVHQYRQVSALLDAIQITPDQNESPPAKRKKKKFAVRRDEF